MCCAESQITGSAPLLSDLDILCEWNKRDQGDTNNVEHLNKQSCAVCEVRVANTHVFLCAGMIDYWWVGIMSLERFGNVGLEVKCW